MKKIINWILAPFTKKKAPKLLTLDQVKQDILSGKCKKIYYSAVLLWWSHDAEDLVESTSIGKAFLIAQHDMETKALKEQKIAVNRDKISKREKLFASFRDAKNLPPLDFLGNKLYETGDLQKWISEAEAHPDVFGRNGLEAFMRMHHKNCSGKSFKTWDEVNYAIDGIAIVNKKEAPVKRMDSVITTPGRNEPCPCGSGKKFKHCCANN